MALQHPFCQCDDPGPGPGPGPGPDPGPITLAGDVTGPSDDTTVEAIQGVPVEAGTPSHKDVLTFDVGDGKAKWQAPHVPDAADIPFDPSGTSLTATNAQAAIAELDTRPPSSDATKIQGVDVDSASPAQGQSLVLSSGGIYIPRFVSPSSDRLITSAGTYTVELGENAYVDVAVGDTELKAPASPPVGATFRVKRLSTNASLVVVDGNGSTIDGDSAVAIKPGEAALFRCYDTGKWARLGKCEAVGDGAVAHLGLDYSPIAFWKLDGTLNDYSGNGRALSGLQVNWGYVTPTYGFQCLLVANGRIETLTGGNAVYDALYTLDDMTIQAIVCAIPSSSELTIANARAASSYKPAWHLSITPTATLFKWQNAADSALVTVSSPAIPRGEWVHLAATRRAVDGKMLAKVYINGMKVAEVGDLDMPLHGGGASARTLYLFTVGNSVTNATFGMAGSVKLHDFALSDAQVYAEAQRAKRAP